MTAAEDWPEVTYHLLARGGANAIQAGTAPEDLLQLPFDVYYHKQNQGDLVVLPPRR